MLSLQVGLMSVVTTCASTTAAAAAAAANDDDDDDVDYDSCIKRRKLHSSGHQAALALRSSCLLCVVTRSATVC